MPPWRIAAARDARDNAPRAAISSSLGGQATSAIAARALPERLADLKSTHDRAIAVAPDTSRMRREIHC
jgi:hypothetical protein